MALTFYNNSRLGDGNRHIILDDGKRLADRDKLDFKGFEITDNEEDNSTEISITVEGGGHVINDLPQQPNMKFSNVFEVKDNVNSESTDINIITSNLISTDINNGLTVGQDGGLKVMVQTLIDKTVNVVADSNGNKLGAIDMGFNRFMLNSLVFSASLPVTIRLFETPTGLGVPIEYESNTVNSMWDLLSLPLTDKSGGNNLYYSITNDNEMATTVNIRVKGVNLA